MTVAFLDQYALRFARTNRRRSPEDLEALGITDGETISKITSQNVPKRSRSSTPTIPERVAEVAWTGLQSVTGGYRYQIEFPRDVGNVVRQLIGDRISSTGDVAVYCEDGRILSMRYDFYQNSMDRLNVPHDVPNVAWAKANKDGIALVRQSSRPGATLDLIIYRPGAAANKVIQRSAALQTLGQTPTRPYGWF
jgi:hypothetical protein